MKKTKEKILETARLLFNRHGYTQVTIRMIALELGISPGNLNYHYKKREDLLEALYFEMVKAFDERVAKLPATEITLEQVRNDIRSSMERMVHYQFFWTDLYNILRESANIMEHFNRVYTKRMQGYSFLFAVLEQKQILRAPEFMTEYEQLAERMLSFSNTWIYAARLYRDAKLLEATEYQANQLLGFLYPYLTPKGKQQLQRLAPNYFG